MASSIPTFGGSAPSTTTASSASSGGSFPQAESNDSTAQSIITQINSAGPQAVAQWFANRGISSSAQASFESGGKLNTYAADLEQFYIGSQSDRESVQNDLVDAGLLSSSDANGLPNSSSVAAFKTAIGNATDQGVSTTTWLQNASSGTAPLENQVAAQNAAGEKNANAPVAVTLENGTTLSATITNAFDQALGYAPDQAQVQSFISQIQGQDTSNAEAVRTEGQQQIAQASDEQSALNKLGPDGIDTVIQAYQQAVHGVPGGANPQGPQVGTATAQAAVPAQPGLTLGATGVPAQPATQGGLPGAPLSVPGALLHNVGDLLSPSNMAMPGEQLPGPTTHSGQKPVINMAPVAAQPAVAGGPQFGGIFALTPGEWKKAQALTPAASKYTTAGAAPQKIQESAFTNLLQDTYDNNGGSWSKAITTIASGSPLGTAEGSHLSTFATGVANQVNSQIESTQSQINNSDITVKTTAPDASAEANLAAKTADPVGYYAANAATAGGILNEMLAGAPQMYGQSTADTFTGPVPAGAAAAAPAAATV